MTELGGQTVAARRSLRDSLKVYFEPRLVAVLFMGFSSGLPLALTSGTLQVWQSRAGVDLSVIGFFVLVGVSYNLKFLWAPVIDRVPPPALFARLGRRRGWAITTQLGLMGSIILLSFCDPVTSPALTALAAILVTFCSASQDIVIDAYRIDLLDEDQQGAGAAMTQYGYRFGMLASGAGALFLADVLPWSTVYLLMAGLVTVGIVTILLTREPKSVNVGSAFATDPRTRRKEVVSLLAIIAAGVVTFISLKFAFSSLGLANWAINAQATIAAAAVPVLLVLLLVKRNPDGAISLWLKDTVVRPFADFVSRSGWAVVLLFIVLFKLGDAIAGVMANPFYVAMGFTNTEIASVSKIFGIVATLVGVFLGGLVVVRIGTMPALILGGLLQMASNLMFAVQAMVGHDVGFLAATIAIENLAGGMGSAAFVAYLSALCNVAFTATQYALFSSLATIGRTVLSSPGGEIAKALGWVDYFIASTFLAIPGLLMLFWLIRRYPQAGKVQPVT